MNTPYGCPIYGMPPLWNWVDYNVYLVSAFLIIFGAGLLQFGSKHYLVSMALISTFGVGFVLLSILYGVIMPATTPIWMVWVSIVLCFGTGAGFGYGAYNWPKVGVFTIGLTVGAFIGTIIYIIFFTEFNHATTIKDMNKKAPVDTQAEEI
jgi:hypothetical protein